jgi:quercetin dioxygenase-like cupin family protein
MLRRMSEHVQERREAPVATPRGAGEAIWWLGALAELKVTAEQTGGRLSVLEVTEPPDASGPLHVHHREDETFLVLAGAVTFEIGGEAIPAAAGDVVFAPRRVPHRYTTGPEGCRLLYVMTPGGFERLVREMGVPATDRTLPPPAVEEPDPARIDAIARAHGCELLA